jgi:hypothetical protein
MMASGFFVMPGALPSLRCSTKIPKSTPREEPDCFVAATRFSPARRPGPHQYPDQREWHLGKRWKLLAKSDGEFARNSDIDAGSVALLVARSDLSYAHCRANRQRQSTHFDAMQHVEQT